MKMSVAKSSGAIRGANGSYSGWTRGARSGNYTAIQRNIACRISQMFDRTYSGDIAYIAPASCPIVTQAKISVGDLPYGTCGKKAPPSICSAGGRR